MKKQLKQKCQVEKKNQKCLSFVKKISIPNIAYIYANMKKDNYTYYIQSLIFSQSLIPFEGHVP